MSSLELPILGRPLDSTAMGAYMACGREYFLSMQLHRRGGGTSASLAYGGVKHKILGTHYKSGGLVEIVEAVAEGWWKQHGHEEEGDHRTLKRAILDYKRYRERWGQKPEDEQGQTVGFPERPMIETPFDIFCPEGGFSWAGRIDRLIELGGLYYVEDHKTTSRLDSNFYKSLEMSNQMMGYTWAAQQLMPSLKIAGVRINTIHILKEKTGFERQLITFTKEQIAEWLQNTSEWARRLRVDAASWPTEQELAEGLRPWPLAHFGDNGCSRKYGLCGYYKLCSVAPAFRHRLLAEFPVHPWNPLEPED